MTTYYDSKRILSLELTWKWKMATGKTHLFYKQELFHFHVCSREEKNTHTHVPSPKFQSSLELPVSAGSHWHKDRAPSPVNMFFVRTDVKDFASTLP